MNWLSSVRSLAFLCSISRKIWCVYSPGAHHAFKNDEMFLFFLNLGMHFLLLVLVSVTVGVTLLIICPLAYLC